MQLSPDTSDAGRKGTKVILRLSNWTICERLVTFSMKQAQNEKPEDFSL